MVFCEAKCRHREECEVLIAADRDHPNDGPFFVHQATDHAKGEVHTWRSRPSTLVSTGYCHVEAMAGHAKQAANQFRTITVRLPGK